jgi:nicotinamidase-related amidase
MSDWRLTPQNCALVVIDAQDKLMAAMSSRANTLVAAEKMIRAARLLQVPTIVTLQYSKVLGPLCAELSEATDGVTPMEKMSFSCCGSEDFTRAIKELRRPRVLICGIETHICVLQTAIDLMNSGHSAYVVADAVGSRRDTDHTIALERLRDCGAVITTVESAIFEMLREAGTAQFKQILPLLK